MKKLVFIFSAFLCMLFCPMTDAAEAKASDASVNNLQQGYIIRIRIVDEEGNPMPGVYVAIADTQYGAVSDVDGNVMLIVPKLNSILVISFVGYEPIERTAIDFIRYDGVIPTVVMSPKKA